MGRARALVIVLIVQAGLLTAPAVAQETDLSGVITVPPEGFDWPAGTTVHVGPNATFTGPGEIRLGGTLIVKGSAAAPVIFTVPLFVSSTGRLEANATRFLTVKQSCIDLNGGTALISNATFEGNDGAIYAHGDASADIRDAAFQNNTGDAVRVEGRSNVSIARTAFLGNGRGASIYSAGSVAIEGSSFADNGQHVFVELGPWSTRGDISFSHDVFAAPAQTAARLAGIALSDAPTVASTPTLIRFESDRIEGAPIGISAQGAALDLESRNDTIVNNSVGLYVQLATVHLAGATLGNDRDLDGSGRVTLDDITYLRQGEAAAATIADGGVWLPWAVGAGILALAVVAILLVPRLAKRAPPPPSPPPLPDPVSPSPAPTPTPAPAPDLALSSTERKILQDIAANPGTAQRAVADRLGTTRQALHYHVKKLEAKGLIIKTVEGRETRCTLPPIALQLLATQTDPHEKA